MKKPVPRMNEEQRKAVEHFHGPMLVVAGAGSGKTQVLTHRVAHLARAHGVAPEEIVAFTYTRNAAKEMRERIAALLPDVEPEKLQVQTFHSYCQALLKAAGKEFRLLDSMELKVYLTHHVRELPLEHFRKASDPARFVTDLADFISRCQDDLVYPEEFREFVRKLEADPNETPPRVVAAKVAADTPREEMVARTREIADVYEHVERHLEEKNWGTYGHLVTRAAKLLKSEPAALKNAQAKCRFLLIDEFQDSNYAQIEISRMLAGEEQNVFAVGDPDQAIYRFRGATSGAFDLFRKCFPKTKMLRLGTNYRSTRAILRCAHTAIGENPDPVIVHPDGSTSGRAELDAGREGAAIGEAAEVLSACDVITEATRIAEAVVERRQQGAEWREIAVLYRAHKNREEMVAEFERSQVPFHVRGVDVSGDSSVRDVIALLRSLAVPGDTVNLLRVAAWPRFKIDPEKLRDELAKAKGELPLEDSMRAAEGGEGALRWLNGVRQKIRAQRLKAHSAARMAVAEAGLPITPALEMFFGFLKRWEGTATTEDGSLEEACKFVETFQELGGRISDEADVLEPGVLLPDPGDAVRLMSVHAAKGLEFPHVFVIRVQSSTFPRSFKEPLFVYPAQLARTDRTSTPSERELHEQEERRLFYVAMTRARDRLMMSGRYVRSPSIAAKYLRELSGAKATKGFLKARIEDRPVARIEAAAAPMVTTPVGQWVSMPPGPGFRVDALSANAIESYDTCPLRYKLEHEWHLPTETAAAVQFGNVIHKALREFYESVRAGAPMDEAALIKLFEAEFDKAGVRDDLQRELYRRDGARQLKEFHRARMNEPLPRVLATEKEFRFEVEGVAVRGRIDRMDDMGGGAVHIEDYKTGDSVDEDKAEKSLQLSIYALAAEAMGKRPEALALYSLAKNERFMTTRDSEALDEVKAKIAEVEKGMRAGEYGPKPGWHCQWCPYRAVCPTQESAAPLPTRAN